MTFLGERQGKMSLNSMYTSKDKFVEARHQKNVTKLHEHVKWQLF